MAMENKVYHFFEVGPIDVGAPRSMESTLFSTKPSVLPRRNPSINNDKIQEIPAANTEEVEAGNRMQIQSASRTISLPAKGSRYHHVIDQIDKSSNGDDYDEVSPIDELRRERPVMVSIRKHTSVVPSRTLRPRADDDDPRLELKGERKESIAPKRSGEANRISSAVPARTSIAHETVECVGSSLPIMAFGRHESKVPTNTAEVRFSDAQVQELIGASLPVQAFGRHESKVLPNTSNVQSSDLQVQDRTGASLPVVTFGRHESKVPPNTSHVQ